MTVDVTDVGAASATIAFFRSTANQRDAIGAIELAVADYEAMFAPPAHR